MKRFLLASILLVTTLTLSATTEDWPEWRGRGRLGVWTETGILEAFPEGGLEYIWRTPVRAGYAGPSVADGRVFVTDFEAGEGMAGTERALALDEETGEIQWTREWPVHYAGLAPTYAIGPRATPTVDGNRVYVLDPKTGQVHWEVPFDVDLGMTVATPVLAGRHLLVSCFFNGSLLLELDEDARGARPLWQVRGLSEIDSDGLHALITTPVIDGEWVYGVGSYGELRGIDLTTGKRRWESLDLIGEKARWAAAFIVRHGDRYIINNDRGELIFAHLTPDGYREIDRTPLIAPTSPGTGRERGAVHWSHPAYANPHLVVRNDREIVRVSLGAP